MVSAVDRLVLFESVTGGGPARYVPLGGSPGRSADGSAGHAEAVAPPGTEAAAAPAD